MIGLTIHARERAPQCQPAPPRSAPAGELRKHAPNHRRPGGLLGQVEFGDPGDFHGSAAATPAETTRAGGDSATTCLTSARGGSPTKIERIRMLSMRRFSIADIAQLVGAPEGSVRVFQWRLRKRGFAIPYTVPQRSSRVRAGGSA